MKRIYEYSTHEWYGEWKVETHKGFKPLSCQIQHGRVTVWFEVDVDSPFTEITFHLVLTGQTIPARSTFIATVQLNEGDHVVHLYQQN